MTFVRSRFVGYVVPVLVIITLTVFLALALLRLANIQQDMRSNADDNMLWVISQAHTEGFLLGEAVYQRFADPRASVDLTLRYNLFLSRLNLLSEGPQARFLEGAGVNAAFVEHYAAIRQMGEWLLTAPVVDASVIQRVHATLQPLRNLLMGASSMAMVAQWEEAGARLDMYRNAVLTIIFLMIGILVCSVFVSVNLLLALKQVRENERSKRHAAELEKQLDAERKASQLYRSFGAMVSHQFRTPLAIIDASMQRLVRGGHGMSSQEVARRANKVREATKRLTRLIESTLIADRISQKVDVKMQQCDLVSLAGEAIDHQLATTPSRLISLDSDANLYDKVWCDPVLTEQILFNFISNAAKYSPESEPIQLRIFQRGAWVGCSVQDKGVGIPENELTQIFDRYFRADASVGVMGTGMGLYVAQQLALMQHGHVQAESVLGEGSIFELRLRSAAGPNPAQSARTEHDVAPPAPEQKDNAGTFNPSVESVGEP